MTERLIPPSTEVADGSVGARADHLLYELPFIGMAVTSAVTKRWVRVNTALCDLLGYSRDELLRIMEHNLVLVVRLDDSGFHFPICFYGHIQSGYLSI